MPLPRLARSALSLLVAYAILAGGVLGASFGLGADPLSQFCSSSAAEPDRSPQPAPSAPHEAHDCCPALCNGQAAVLPPLAEIGQAVRFALRMWPSMRQTSVRTADAQFWLARAPPAG